MWLAKLDAFAHDLFVMLTIENTVEVKAKPELRPELKSVGDVS
jgi:hypothetical protein